MSSDLELAFFADCGPVSLLHLKFIKLNRAPRHLKPRVAMFVERVHNVLVRTKDRRVDPRVLVDGHRTFAAIIRGDESESSTPVGFAKKLLFVTGRKVLRIR